MSNGDSSPKMPTIDEGLAMVSAAKPFRILDLRNLLGRYEFVQDAGDHRQTRVTQKINTDENKVIIRVEFNAIILCTESGSPSKQDEAVANAEPVSQDVKFEMHTGMVYEFSPDEPEHNRLLLARFYSIMHLWPFWRSFVYESSARLGMVSNVMQILQNHMIARIAGFRDTTISSEVKEDGGREIDVEL